MRLSLSFLFLSILVGLSCPFGFCQSNSLRLLSQSSSEVGDKGFVTGFNQAWLHNSYGSQWTRNWDEAEARRLLKACADNGAKVIRMWLFEGLSFEGVIWDDDPQKSAYGYSGTRTRPTGLAPEKLQNIERFLVIAEEEGVAVYLTFFDANIYSQNNPAKARRKDEWWNVLNDEYAAGAGFRGNVLSPIIQACSRHRNAVFAIDLVNEINALVKEHWFKDGWQGARTFVTRWRSFIRRLVPDMPVSASFGHHDAVSALVDGRLRADEVDFYDFHLYNNSGSIPDSDDVTALARRLAIPIYLGEFGQKSSAYDNDMQSRVLRSFLLAAKNCGLAGAFAWRLSDIRDGYNPEARFSFEAFGTWRPAMDVFRSMSSK